jgi:hypothetical protein
MAEKKITELTSHTVLSAADLLVIEDQTATETKKVAVSVLDDRYVKTTGALTNKNMIINGDMRIAQRGTTFAGVSSGAYTLDRYKFDGGGTFDVARTSVTNLDGFTNALRITDKSGTITGQIIQPMEDFGQFYTGQVLTVSFWARANAAQTRRVYLYGDTDFTSGNYQLANVTTDWQRFDFQFTNDGSSTVLNGHDVRISQNAVTSINDWCEITGLQVERGTVATPYEHKHHSEELASCYRYYWRPTTHTSGSSIWTHINYNGGLKSANSFLSLQIDYPVKMRTTPTPTYRNEGTNDRVGSLNSGSSLASTQVTPVAPYTTHINDTNVIILQYTEADYGFMVEFWAEAEL